jgi:hypothetical protein
VRPGAAAAESGRFVQCNRRHIVGEHLQAHALEAQLVEGLRQNPLERCRAVALAAVLRFGDENMELRRAGRAIDVEQVDVADVLAGLRKADGETPLLLPLRRVAREPGLLFGQRRWPEIGRQPPVELGVRAPSPDARQIVARQLAQDDRVSPRLRRRRTGWRTARATPRRAGSTPP